ESDYELNTKIHGNFSGRKKLCRDNTAGYMGTVVGSAIYTGAHSSIKEFLSGLNLAAGTKIGSFWQLAKLNYIGRCSNES
ncbi:MAG: hypothetical protein WC046_06595, partial [Candidatus Bathyarchaeia archaeon]